MITNKLISVPVRFRFSHAYIMDKTRSLMEKGVVIDQNSQLIIKLDIGYGRMLLDMFAIIEENGSLSEDLAKLYDLLKRQIPQ